MTAAVTYEMTTGSSGSGVVYAVLNDEFVKALTIERLFGLVQDKSTAIPVVSDNRGKFAVVLDADKNASALTEMIDVVNEVSETRISVDNIRPMMSRGKSDVMPTAGSVEEIIRRVKDALDAEPESVATKSFQ